jgi:hypothetical protein
MANCLQFNKEADLNPGNSGTSRTRALVSELLAIKLLKEYTTRELIDALSYDFYPLQGQVPLSAADLRTPNWNQSYSKSKNATGDTRISCLEIAIRAQAKRFISHPLVVQHLEAIWAGTIVFHSAADNLHRPHGAAIRYGPPRYGAVNTSENQQHSNKAKHAAQSSDNPRRAVTLYDPRDASLFKLSRLRVPRYRHFLSTISFAALLGLYLAVLVQRSIPITTVEVIFWLWSAGFMLDEVVGFNEQGFSLYLMSFWNLFDLGILLLLFCYTILRLYVMAIPDSRQLAAANQAYDLLAAGAVLLFPRLFSVLDHYKYFSQLLIAFRIMAADLMAVFLLIVVACSGFLVAFSFSSVSSKSPQEVTYGLFQILMGFTPTAWSLWEEYNALGWIILTVFLFICHFVVVTILITVLTNSFMAIVKNAHEEHQFLFAINTISMVKSDAMFSYVAPSNIIGWLLTPLRYFVPLRDFVKLNRTLIKITHFPILWSICFYERMILSSSIIDPTELVEAANGRSTAVLRARNERQSRFDTFHRLTREPSIATYQQDRVLEELFRRPFRQQSMQDIGESPDGRRKNTMVKNWMQGMDTIDELTPKPPMALRRANSPLHRNYTETTRSVVASDPEEFLNHGNLHPVPEHSILRSATARLGRYASHATDVEGDDEKSSDENHDDESDEYPDGSILNSLNAGNTPRPSSKSTPKFFSSRPSTAVYNSRKNSPTRNRPVSGHRHGRNASSVTVLHNHHPQDDDSTDDALPGPSSASPLKALDTENSALPQRSSFMATPNFNRTIGSDIGDVGVLPSSLATQIAIDGDVLGRLVLARMQNIEAGFREVLKEVKDLHGKPGREPRYSSRKTMDDEA